jgi:hypothetical protein
MKIKLQQFHIIHLTKNITMGIFMLMKNDLKKCQNIQKYKNYTIKILKRIC